MKQLHLYLLSFLLLFSITATGQSVHGTLGDAKTGERIPAASISLTGKSQPAGTIYTSSDSTGNFSFSRLAAGTYTLSVTMIGYQRLNMDITLSPSQKLDIGTLALKEDANLLSMVTITAGTPGFSTKAGQLKVAVASNPFFKAASNLTEVIRRLPGLQVSSEGTMLLSSGAAPVVLIDGKQLNMNAQEIQAYLAGLSPELVESIELISEPSSKYDGQFQGILDIRLKRSLSSGLKGSYGSRYQQNQRSLVDNTLSLAYKTKKFTYGLSLGRSDGSTFYHYHAMQLLPNTNSLETSTRTITSGSTTNAQARAAFEPTRGQSIELYLRSFYLDRKARTDNQLQTTDQSHKLRSESFGKTNARPDQRSQASGLSYDLGRGKTELHLLASLAQIDNRQREDIGNTTTGSPGASYWKSASSNNISIHSLQADYAIKMGTGKLELGARYARTATKNDMRYDTLSNGTMVYDPSRSSHFAYTERISAGYIHWGATLEKLSYSAAIRAEHTATQALAQGNGSATQKNYVKWLPSASISYKVSEQGQLNLNYSRRLTRPTFDALNPFRFYYSVRHYWVGNPELQPSTTSLFSLSYARAALNLTLGAGREKDPMVRYPEYDPVTNILVFKGNNVPYRNFINLRASLPLTLSTWWKTSNTATGNYNRELRPYLGRQFQVPVFNYTLSGSQLFTLKALVIELSYSLESKSGNSLYVFGPVRTVDLSLQHSWLKGQLSTKIAFQDIFDGGKRRIIFRDRSIMDNDFYHDNSVQKLVLGINFSFGNSTHKQREIGRSEEEKRVNN